MPSTVSSSLRSATSSSSSSCGVAEAGVDRAHVDVLRLLALVADVDVRGGIVAHQHGRESRHVATAGGGELAHTLGDPLANLGGDRLAVDRPCAHTSRLNSGGI